MPRVGSRHRCPECLMSGLLCLCDDLPKVPLRRTRVIVLMHYLELKTSTNTARIANLMLPESEVRLRGRPGQPLEEQGLVVPERRSLFLFPSPQSRVLDGDFLRELSSEPVNLIVPDGSWRQAQKVAQRVPALAGVQHVRLEPGPPSEYQLRAEPNPEAVCTLEAIARALGVLEGQAVRDSMEHWFRVMVERTLWSRGKLKDTEAPNVPDEAKFARRRSGASSG